MLQLIVFISMCTELLDLICWNNTLTSCFTFVGFLNLSNMPFWKNSEATEFYLSSGYGLFRIYNYCNEWFLMSLIKWLCAYIYSREPASIPRMWVIPSTDIFRSMHKLASIQMCPHKFISFTSRVHSCLCTHDRQCEWVHHIESI